MSWKTSEEDARDAVEQLKSTRRYKKTNEITFEIQTKQQENKARKALVKLMKRHWREASDILQLIASANGDPLDPSGELFNKTNRNDHLYAESMSG